jgi:hypothetical protein
VSQARDSYYLALDIVGRSNLKYSLFRGVQIVMKRAFGLRHVLPFLVLSACPSDLPPMSMCQETAPTVQIPVQLVGDSDERPSRNFIFVTIKHKCGHIGHLT